MLVRPGVNPAFLRFFRLALLILGVFYTIMTFVFLQRPSLTGDLWPWAGTYNSLNGLSATFIAAVIAATAASLIWVALIDEPAAATGGAINLLIVFGGSGLFLLQGYLNGGNSRLLVAAVISGILMVGSLATLRLGTKLSFRDNRSQPLPVRISFAVFIFVLLVVGVLLLLKSDGIIPWAISVETRVIYGWVFLGAGLYFGYAWLRPNWANTSGQLAGFLAYDLVLLYPFLVYLPRVPDRFRLSLIIYIVILVYSAVLAVYYLFINPKTRFWRTVSTDQVTIT